MNQRNQRLLRAVGLTLFTATAPIVIAQHAATADGNVSATKVALSGSPTSGINLKNMDASVRPQDDFYAYTNGAWLKKTVLPPDKSRWG